MHKRIWKVHDMCDTRLLMVPFVVSATYEGLIGLIQLAPDFESVVYHIHTAEYCTDWKPVHDRHFLVLEHCRKVQ